MDIFLNKYDENLLDFLAENFDIVKNKNIIISRGVVYNFSNLYKRMFIRREPKVEEKNNGLYYTYDLSIVFDENFKSDESIKIFDDLSHRGLFKIMAFSLKDKKYRTSIYNTDTVYFYENIDEKNIINGKGME